MPESATLKVCSVCSHPIGNDPYDLHEHNGAIYCESCFGDTFFTCSNCGESVEADDIIVVDRGTRYEDYVCSDCLDDYRQCDGCDEYFHVDRIYLSDSVRSYCESCSEQRVVCARCEAVIWTDDSCWDENTEEYYCTYCYREHHVDAIHDYNYTPDWNHYGLEDGKTSWLGGVELEVDCGDNRNDAAEAITALGDELFCKEDGSLHSGGFEIVSHPCTLEYHSHTLQWDKVVQIAREHGFKSHNTSTCGLHVHVNRTFFGPSEDPQDLGIAKLLILTNNLWEQLVILSRRDINRLDQWAAKVELNLESYDTRKTIIDKAKGTRHNYKGRYQAWNLTNRHTVECRIFRGTLNLDTFYASLQLTQALCQYAKRHSLAHVQTTTWGTFRKTLKGTKLLAYIELKGL